MKIYFHIGSHKTGTTTIQSLLFKNRNELLKKRYLYPSSGCTKTKAHHNLVYESVGSWKYNNFFGGWSELEKEILESKVENVIISAENFSGYYKDDRVIDDIKKICFNLKAIPVIIACIRPQVDYVDSIYSQNCATGYEVRKYEDYLLDSFVDPAFDFEKVLGRWFENFSDVRIIDYSELGLNGFHSFFSSLGCDYINEKSSLEKNLNSRRSAHVVEFCRKANFLLRKSGGFPPKVRHNVILKISSYTSDFFPCSRPFKGMSGNRAKLVNDVFDAKNSLFFKKRLSGKPMFSKLNISDSFSEEVSAFDIDNAGSECINAFMDIYTRALVAALS